MADAASEATAPRVDGRTRTRRLRGASAERGLHRYLERHEPWSSAALASVFQWGLDPRYNRAWLVEDQRGTPVAACVLSSPCVARWQAYCAIDDPSAAPSVARLIDRSPATHLAGFIEHVEPVLPHLTRLYSAGVAAFSIDPCTRPLRHALDEQTRLAVPPDLDALVALFEHFGIGIERTRWQLRSTLRRLLHHYPVVVAEEGGRMVAAVAISGLTRRYSIVDQLVVHPDARGLGLSWMVGSRMQAIITGLGLPVCGVPYATNPMSLDGMTVRDGAWVYAGLFEPRRFRGQARLRELLFRYQALPGNQNQQFRPFTALPYGAAYDPRHPDRAP